MSRSRWWLVEFTAISVDKSFKMNSNFFCFHRGVAASATNLHTNVFWWLQHSFETVSFSFKMRCCTSVASSGRQIYSNLKMISCKLSVSKLVNAIQQLSSRYLYCFFNHFNSKSIDIKFGGPKIDFRPFGFLFFYTFWYEIFVEFKRIYFKFVA